MATDFSGSIFFEGEPLFDVCSLVDERSRHPTPNSRPNKRNFDLIAKPVLNFKSFLLKGRAYSLPLILSFVDLSDLIVGNQGKHISNYSQSESKEFQINFSRFNRRQAQLILLQIELVYIFEWKK